MPGSTRSIYAALAANILIAGTKFIAGSISRSSAMISEAIHSLVDCINELFLLLGIRRSNKARDKKHPFGYGRELYFWSFVVSILIFGLGAGISFYQGYMHLKSPVLASHLSLNYVVLGFSLLFDGWSFIVALKAFNKIRGDQSIWRAIVESKDPSSFMVLLEDGAAVTGIGVVFICLFLGDLLKNPYLDGIASLVVSLLLALISFVLARESRSLLMGEGISRSTEIKIASLVNKDEAVLHMQRIFSIYQSPDEVLIVLIISFKKDLRVNDINLAIERLKNMIRTNFPKITFIIIEPQEKEQVAKEYEINKNP